MWYWNWYKLTVTYYCSIITSIVIMMELSAITFKFKKRTSDYIKAHSINGTAVVNNNLLIDRSEE